MHFFITYLSSQKLIWLFCIFLTKKTATFCDGLHVPYYMFKLFSKTQILRHRTAEADMQTNISVRRTPV